MAAALAVRPPFSPFSHMNRASYKGECRRLMSRTNMETVAERAAHFEDIDPDRYNRMKSKFDDLGIQYGEEYKKRFGNQPPPPLGYFVNQVNSNNINMLNSFVDSIMMLPASRSSSQQSQSNNGSGKSENNVATSANINTSAASNYFNSEAATKLMKQSVGGNNNNSFNQIYDEINYEDNMNGYMSIGSGNYSGWFSLLIFLIY